MQQLVHEQVIAAPIWQLAALSGVGPRVGEFGVRPDARLSVDLALRGHDAEGRLSGAAAKRQRLYPLVQAEARGKKGRDSNAAAALQSTAMPCSEEAK